MLPGHLCFHVICRSDFPVSCRNVGLHRYTLYWSTSLFCLLWAVLCFFCSFPLFFLFVCFDYFLMLHLYLNITCFLPVWLPRSYCTVMLTTVSCQFPWAPTGMESISSHCLNAELCIAVKQLRGQENCSYQTSMALLQKEVELYGRLQYLCVCDWNAALFCSCIELMQILWC